MSFSEDKTRMTEYMKERPLDEWEDEAAVEEFFCFLDRIAEQAKEDSSYCAILSDAYLKAGDPLKAKEAFARVYNPKNKKDIKKLMSFDSWKANPVTRPSEKAGELPDFTYVSGKLLKNKFVRKKDGVCCICNKSQTALYVGAAFTDTSEKINFLNTEDQFCADCIRNGAAAEKLGITFNDPYLQDITVVDDDKKDELLRKTPECSLAFDFDEDMWPCCCGDFCRYEEYDGTYEETFTFRCRHCGKETVWTKMT